MQNLALQCVVEMKRKEGSLICGIAEDSKIDTNHVFFMLFVKAFEMFFGKCIRTSVRCDLCYSQ